MNQKNQSSPLRLAVIGAGRWGPNLIKNFDSFQKSEVKVVADSDSARLDLIRNRYPHVSLSTQAAEVIQRSDIDAVVICSPTATHFELAKLALESGKHVFVEKPLARTSLECEKLVEIANQKQLTLFVGHIFVYNAGIQAVKKYIESGELGKVYYIHVTRTNLGPVRNDVSAHWDLASHDLSIVNYWTESYPTHVSAQGGRYLNERLEDVTFATYRYPREIMAHVHVSWLNPKKTREIILIGEKKMLVWDDMDLSSPIQIYNKKVTIDQGSSLVDSFAEFRASIYEGDTLIPKIKLNEPLLAECTAFLEAVENQGKSLSNGIEGMRVVDALIATDASIQAKGKEVEIRYL